MFSEISETDFLVEHFLVGKLVRYENEKYPYHKYPELRKGKVLSVKKDDEGVWVKVKWPVVKMPKGCSFGTEEFLAVWTLKPDW